MNVEVLGDDIMYGFTGAAEKTANATYASINPMYTAKVTNDLSTFGFAPRMRAKFVDKPRVRVIDPMYMAQGNPIAPYTRFGDDVYGADASWQQYILPGLDLAKSIVDTIGVGRKRPTQKAQDEENRINPPPPPPVDPIKANMPYIIIGGTVLIGALFLVATKKPRA